MQMDMKLLVNDRRVRGDGDLPAHCGHPNNTPFDRFGRG